MHRKHVCCYCSWPHLGEWLMSASSSGCPTRWTTVQPQKPKFEFEIRQWWLWYCWNWMNSAELGTCPSFLGEVLQCSMPSFSHSSRPRCCNWPRREPGRSLHRRRRFGRLKVSHIFTRVLKPSTKMKANWGLESMTLVDSSSCAVQSFNPFLWSASQSHLPIPPYRRFCPKMSIPIVLTKWDSRFALNEALNVLRRVLLKESQTVLGKLGIDEGMRGTSKACRSLFPFLMSLRICAVVLINSVATPKMIGVSGCYMMCSPS